MVDAEHCLFLLFYTSVCIFGSNGIEFFGHNSPALLDAKCSRTEQCHLLIPNSICALPEHVCLCARGEALDGGRCLPPMLEDDEKMEDIAAMNNNEECQQHEVRKRGQCHPKKAPGETCQFTEQCMDAGSIQYQCIANLCQIPPECAPGHVSIGPECFPFSVTGGDCAHPIQCLSGSVCIRGKCRGPCETNQVFVEDNCVDYEGAGCIARTCVQHRCPRPFPSCNYVPQKDEYLCCERQIRSTAQCPDPRSVPQISQVVNDVINCMTQQCGPGFTCQFSNYSRGSYICCSIPTGPLPDRKEQRRREKEKRMNGRRSSNSRYYLRMCIG